MDIQLPRRRRRFKLWFVVVFAGAALVTVWAYARATREALPQVSNVALAKVRRGTLKREVHATGRLVPEATRWVTAVTAGRVESIAVKAGDAVQADALLIRLTNPDVALAALQAERELATARAELVELQTRLETQALTEQAQLALLKAERANAERRAIAYEQGAGLVVSELEAKQAHDHALDTVERWGLAQKRTALATSSMRQILAAYREQLARREQLSKFQREQLERLSVRAGAEGVVTELPLEPGQWAISGAVLATIIRPDRLKAELRVAEILAKDVTPDQAVQIDTHTGIIAGRVSRIATAARDGIVLVEVALEGALPAGARSQLNIEGNITLGTLDNVLYVDRPQSALPETTSAVYRVSAAGSWAERVSASFGRASVTALEVRAGLNEGDELIVSDTSNFESESRVALK